MYRGILNFKVISHKVYHKQVDKQGKARIRAGKQGRKIDSKYN